MRGRKRLILIAVLMLMLAASTLGCIRPPEEEGRGEARIALKVGTMPDEATLPYYVAAQEGIFAEHGLDVEVVPFMSALERDSALIAGKIDAGENDPVGVLVLRNAGHEITIVSTELHETREKMRFAILASPHSNISSVEELEGKKIAISRNTIIEWVTDALLDGVQANKIEEKKVPLRLQMLLADQVDAATLAEPLASYAMHMGARLLISDSMLNETISYTLIVFRSEFVREHPESVERFLAAYNEAVDRINANPEKYQALVVEIAKVPEEIAGSYQMATYLKAQPYPREKFEAVVSWMQAKGLVTREITYEDVVYHGA